VAKPGRLKDADGGYIVEDDYEAPAQVGMFGWFGGYAPDLRVDKEQMAAYEPYEPEDDIKMVDNGAEGPPLVPSGPKKSKKPAPKKPEQPQAQVYDPGTPNALIPEEPSLATQANLGDLQQNYEDHLGGLDPNDRFGSTDPGDRLNLYNRSRDELVAQSVKTPPAPAEFLPLQVGPEVGIEVENSLLPSPEASQALLRQLSPFMFQVEPPLPFGEDGGFLARQGNNISLDTFANAMSGYKGYEAARTAVAQSALAVGINGKTGSLQGFIQANSQKEHLTWGEVQPTTSQTNLGEPAIADMLAAVDIARQVSGIMQIPPLVMLINPATLSIDYTKIQQFQERTRYGFVFHAWGEEQPTLSISARCGAFVSGGRGVQYASKRDSLSWQNLMNAFHLYKSNGYIYDTIGKSNAHHFIGALSIHYDQWIYYGHIESFNWTYDEGNELGGVEFSIEFTVSAMADMAQQPFVVMPMKSPTLSPSDPRYYGEANQAQNQPGNYSVGLGPDGKPRVTTQGHIATGDDFGVLVPGGLESPLEKGTGFTKSGGGTGGTPVGSGGFEDPKVNEPLGQRIVTTEATQFSGPFGLR